MKLTKTQLRQIIKEELSRSINEDDESDQRVVDKVKEVVTLFSTLYNSLVLPQDPHGFSAPDNEARALFEYYLNENVKAYTQRWQKDRKPAIEEPAEEEI